MADDFTTFGSAPPSSGTGGAVTPGVPSGWAQQLFASNPFANRYNFKPIDFSSTPNIDDNSFVTNNATIQPSSANGGGSSVNSGGNWFDNIMSGIKNAGIGLWHDAEGVGAGIRNAVMNAPLMTASTLAAPLLGAQNNTDTGSVAKAASSTFDPSQAFVNAYNNPSIAPTGRQMFDFALGGHDVPYLSAVGGFLTDMPSNPLTYVPVAPVARAIGLTPALKFGLDWAKGAVKGADVAANVAKESMPQDAESVLKSNPNLMNDFLNSSKPYESNYSSNIINELSNAAKQVAPAAEDASITKAPYAAYNWQSKLGQPIANALTKALPNGIPGVPKVADGMNYIGKKLNPFPIPQPAADRMRQAMDINIPMRERDAEQFLVNTLNGVKPEQYNELFNALHGGEASPEMMNIADAIKSKIGDVTNEDVPLGIRQNSVNDYVPRKVIDPEILNTVDATKSGVGTGGKLGIGGANQARTITNPLEFEQQLGRQVYGRNPINYLFPRMSSSIRAQEYQKAINDILTQYGKQVDGKYVLNPETEGIFKQSQLRENLAKTFPELFGKTPEEISSMSHEQLSKLAGDLGGDTTHVLPKDIADYLNNFVKPQGETNKVVDTVLNLLNIPKLYNIMYPAMHFHNIGWQAGTTDAKSLLPNNLVKAATDRATMSPVAHEAEKYGAVLPETLTRGSMEKRLGQLSARTQNGRIGQTIENIKQRPINGTLNAINTPGNKVLFGGENILRQSMFNSMKDQGIKSGLTEEEAAQQAAQKIREALPTGTRLTQGEHRVGQAVAPFYSWSKFILPQQAKMWLNRPFVQSLPFQIMNEVNKSTTGHGLLSNPSGKELSVATGKKDKNGNDVYVDPYGPFEEIPKLLKDGPISWAYGKTQPIWHVLEGLHNNNQMPGTGSQMPIWDQNLVDQGLENKTKDIANYAGKELLYGGNGIAQALKNIVTGKADSTDYAQALGSFTKTDNPQKDAKKQAYNQQSLAQSLIKYDKQNGISITKDLKKQAYGKVKIPIIANQ